MEKKVQKCRCICLLINNSFSIKKESVVTEVIFFVVYQKQTFIPNKIIPGIIYAYLRNS